MERAQSMVISINTLSTLYLVAWLKCSLLGFEMLYDALMVAWAFPYGF